MSHSPPTRPPTVMRQSLLKLLRALIRPLPSWRLLKNSRGALQLPFASGHSIIPPTLWLGPTDRCSLSVNPPVPEECLPPTLPDPIFLLISAISEHASNSLLPKNAQDSSLKTGKGGKAFLDLSCSILSEVHATVPYGLLVCCHCRRFPKERSRYLTLLWIKRKKELARKLSRFIQILIKGGQEPTPSPAASEWLMLAPKWREVLWSLSQWKCFMHTFTPPKSQGPSLSSTATDGAAV